MAEAGLKLGKVQPVASPYGVIEGRAMSEEAQLPVPPPLS
jgi:hypothetical protein